MRTITPTELKLILDLHAKYLRGENGGERANLSHADLSGADLSHAHLSGAHLSRADLSGANLSRADLSGAHLSSANLSGANLYCADLSGAHLSGADLYRAHLSSAYLYRAHLSSANLYRAHLSGAYLYRANLSGANLYCADLSGAHLSGEQVAALIHKFSIVPEEGPFYAYKQLRDGVIATLYVPRSAQRLGGLVGRKCRVSKVKVVSLSKGTSALDKHSGKLEYTVGRWVKPDEFDPNPKEECTNGIHVFITKQEAIEY